MHRFMLPAYLLAALSAAAGLAGALIHPAVTTDQPVVVMSPSCPAYPIPECGDWLVFEPESSTSTTATIRVDAHKSGPIKGYFWSLKPWQVNAQVHGIPCASPVPGQPCSPPIQAWVVENLGAGIEWTFKLSEIGQDRRGCPLVLACSSVSFELSPFDQGAANGVVTEAGAAR